MPSRLLIRGPLLSMFFEPPIRRMRVEAFRGFRDAQEFDLNASAVIVTGPNGTGKTSFFDAMQWCLVGSIERLEDLRARRNVEHIVNQYRLSGRASVEMDLVVRGRTFTIRRTGDHRGSTLEFREDGSESHFGDEAENSLQRAMAPSGELTVAAALSTSGLMQQDVMRAVLEAKPADRYRHLSNVLGLGQLEQFEQEVRDVARDAKARADSSRQERESVENTLAATRARIEVEEQKLLARPQLDSLREELFKFARTAPPGLVVNLSPDDLVGTVPSGLLSSLEAASDLIDAFERARTQVRSFGQVNNPVDLKAELEAASTLLSAASVSVSERLHALQEAESRNALAEKSSEEMARLAAAAIPLLTHVCPVCGQDIDAEHVRQELVALSGETDSVVRARKDVDEAKAAVKEAEETEASLSVTVKEFQVRQREWDQYKLAADEYDAAVVGLGSAGPFIDFGDPEGEAFGNGLSGAREYLRSVRRRLGEYVEAIDRATDRTAVERAESEVRRLTEALAVRVERAEADAHRASALKSLEDAALDARVEVTESRFRAVQPLVSDIYSRLDPHPAFKAIEFELDTYYRRGTTSPVVRDPIAGVTADPLMIFSTSQANIAALSYFLAMGWSAGDAALPFVLLDDPIQSMDDVNVLGFADLCRHLRQDRQLIISTHERRFAGLLERKLAPRSGTESTRTIKFVAWDRSGPVVEEQALESQHVPDPIRVVQLAS